jgi:hypothetical protein
MASKTYSDFPLRIIDDVTEGLKGFAYQSLFANGFDSVFGVAAHAKRFQEILTVRPEVKILDNGELKNAPNAFLSQIKKSNIPEILIQSASGQFDAPSLGGKNDLARVNKIILKENT